EAGLKDVYRRGPSTVIAGALLPTGAALPVPGGDRLTGHWTFASGCQHAGWMLGSSTVMAQGAPPLRPDRRPDGRAFFVPVEACTILDTWHTAGLRGTGSHDWQVADVFVPQDQTVPMLRDGPRAPGSLALRDFAAFAGPRVAAVTLGIARDALDTFTALARTKTPVLATSPLATQPTTHERVGRAEALWLAGRAFLYETGLQLPQRLTCSQHLSD